MDRDTRNAIERATQQARKLLEDDFSSQLEGTFDVLRTGIVTGAGGAHLSARQVFQREKIVAAIEHKRATGMTAAGAVADYIRDAAFTTVNRFVALKMLEARELVQECITKGEQSAGYNEFYGLAPGVALLPDAAGYRLYIESLFDELSTEVKVLFDRRDPASLLWPRRQTLEELLAVLNAGELVAVWGEDETIGWVYQYFNCQDERREMREASQAPRNSRELAVRNQFFTPRYVVQFLTDNTLGRIWYEMRQGETRLIDICEYLVRTPTEVFGADGNQARTPDENKNDDEALSQEELLKKPVQIAVRAKKDARDLKVLDPACGSGHFLLCAFDLFVPIYEEGGRTKRAQSRQPPTIDYAMTTRASTSCAALSPASCFATTSTASTSTHEPRRLPRSRSGCGRSARTSISASRATSARRFRGRTSWSPSRCQARRSSGTSSSRRSTSSSRSSSSGCSRRWSWPVRPDRCLRSRMKSRRRSATSMATPESSSAKATKIDGARPRKSLSWRSTSTPSKLRMAARMGGGSSRKTQREAWASSICAASATPWS